MDDLIRRLQNVAGFLDSEGLVASSLVAREAAAELDRLRRELEKRAKQLGVACDKHDLTHALACGRCLAEAREWILSAPHLYSCALLKPYDQRVICTCGRDALLAAMAEPLEVQP